MENLSFFRPGNSPQRSTCSLRLLLRRLQQIQMSSPITTEQKKRITFSSAWSDAHELIWVHRHRLALGMLLMIINRLVGLVLPASSKFLIDDVIIKQRSELLVPLALAAGGATLIQALSSFA